MTGPPHRGAGTFTNVVIGVEALDESLGVIHAARTLAPGAEVTLVNVYPYGNVPGRTAIYEYVEIVRDEALEMLMAKRDEAELQAAALQAIPDPSPARGLKRFAGDAHADLLVVGAGRHGVLGRLALGDVSRAVLQRAPCPVLVAARSAYANADVPAVIGVAFDGSLESQHGLSLAASLAAELGAHLELLEVIELGGLPATWGFQVTEYLDGLVEPAQERLDALAAAMPVPAVARVVRGSVHEELGAFARRVDLMVCGSRGWGPAARVAFGSAADSLIHHAPCPVLVVPRGAEVPEGVGLLA